MTHEITYNYVEPLDPNLLCAICQSALIDPITTNSCKHTFCRDCIEQAVKVKAQCPIDRSVLTMGGWRDTEMLVKLMLDELKVQCTSEGCGMIMQRGLLLSHSRTCQKALVTCQDGDCGLSMARYRLPHHRAYECFQRRMECKRCGTILLFRDRTAHCDLDDCKDDEIYSCPHCEATLGPDKHLHQWTCPRADVPCSHATRGCSAIIPRADLATHLETCPFEAMSAFFEMNDNRFKNLEEKNRTLHNENCALRNELTDVRDEIGILRRGIENVRTNDRIPSSTEREGDGLTNARENIFTESPPIRPPLRPLYNFNTRNFDSRTAISDPPSPRTSRNALPDISTASAATDNFGGVTPRAAADLARHAQAGSVLTPSFGSHQSYADWAFGRLSGLSSASLDEVIDRLRSAIVGLAAGMDTMERRNEVRTMTESLRVLEEVGSLRAIVTTMRMQVMMERPSRRPSLQFSHSASSVRSNNQDPHHFTGHQDADSTGDNDSLEDENRAPSVRESIVFTPLGRTDSSARSSTSSLVTSQAVAGRSVGRSGAGLTGRSVGIPLEEEVGGANTGHNGRRGSRLSRANPVNLIRKQPSRLGSGAARL